MTQVVVDKENRAPLVNNGVKKKFNAKTFESDGQRDALVDKVLMKGCPAGVYEELFKLNASRLVHLPPITSTKSQITKLENDTSSLGNDTYAKLKIWTSFAEYIEKHNPSGCTRLVFRRMNELGIARFYKEFYEHWAAFEFRQGSVKEAKEVVQMAIQKKVVDPSKEDVFNVWKQRYSKPIAEADDETVAFVPARKLDKESNEPTIVFGQSGEDSTQQQQQHQASNEPTITFKSSKVKKKFGLGRLSRIGPAKRVVFSQDEEKSEKPTKEKILERIGDVSYIKNWAPERTIAEEPEQSVENTAEQSVTEKCDTPTIVFNTNGNNKRREPTGSLEPTATFHSRAMENTESFDSTQPMRPRGTSSVSDFRPSLPPEIQHVHDKLLSSKNIFVVNGKQYLRLSVIGRGGSSKVYKTLAIHEPEPRINALKRIKLQRTDQASIGSFLNEIALMERLRGNPNIITLIDSEVNLEKRVIYMVMEHGEIDLNTMLQKQRKHSKASETSTVGMVGNLSLNFVRMTWMNMLEAVHAIHEEKIVHGDLKPANFLFVKGKLKLIDFGIAKAISNDTTNIMRDTQIGTLNYMSPEAIIDTNSTAGSKPKIGAPGMRLKLGRASDIWSMGCILYQMVYGHTPFSELKLIQKIHCISDPNHKIDFPKLDETHTDLLNVVKCCLTFSPRLRPPIVGEFGLLSHPFLNPRSCNAKNLVEFVLQNVSRINSLRFSDNTEEKYCKLMGALQDNNMNLATNILDGSPQKRRAGNDKSTASAPTTKPRRVSAPRQTTTLQRSILSGKARLKPLASSSSAKYMRNQTPPKEKDLASLLKEGLEKKREILESNDNTIEAISRNGDTFELWEFKS